MKPWIFRGLSDRRNKKKKMMETKHGIKTRGGKRSRTKFQKYLELEQKKVVFSAQEDLEVEKRLEKKLKVLNGKLKGPSDGLSDLLDGMTWSSSLMQGSGQEQTKSIINNAHVADEEDLESTAFGSEEDDIFEDDSKGEGVRGSSSTNDSALGFVQSVRSEQEENIEGQLPMQSWMATFKDGISGSAKYLAPHLRAPTLQLNDVSQAKRRTRGLLNRLSEENVEMIAGEIESLFQVHGRPTMTELIANEIMEGVCTGPRGNEQYAAVFAAFVAGLSCLVGMAFGANFMASFAGNFEGYRKKGDSLAVRNMALLLSYLYMFKLLASDLLYDVLNSLCMCLGELEVSAILNILQLCGMGLRSEDPCAMKEFVCAIQNCYAELKADPVTGHTISASKRMQFMLGTIVEIKNNRRQTKPDSLPHARLKKWLQKLGIEEVQLRALMWKRLFDPQKKGQWWLIGRTDDNVQLKSNIDVVGAMQKEAVEAEKLMELAATQRMNTDTRRAIFCIVMSSDDYLDAFEKLLRLKLPGTQDREIIRVIVECCLQEKLFNKYYFLLVGKLCHYDKNHKFTLQYCLWDHFKLLSSMDTRRIINLAHLLADLVANFSISLAVLKVIDFMDVKSVTPKVILHFRIFLKVLLTTCSDETIWNAFNRIASIQELESLRSGLCIFLHQHVLKGAQAHKQEESVLIKRSQLAKKAMANVSGLCLTL